jgi:hypothetical protein
MLSRIPSVKDTYFQHKVLTPVAGKPTYESLQNILNELKANASSVPSTLGGGQHGHLGLLISDTRYTALANTLHWVSPGNPGPFDPPDSTGPQIEAAKDVWKELKQTFELSQATEKALIAQVVEATDAIYLRSLLNRATGQYSSSIRNLITHLFDTYGKITPQQVKAKEVELYNLHYDISQPVDTVFNAIDDLSELAEHAGSPMSPQQMIDLAYVIFAKQPILQQDLRLWNRKPLIDRTWPTMMTHLREAQTDLSSLPSAGDIYHQQPPHQANVATMAQLVAQRLLDDQSILQTAYDTAHPSTDSPPAPPADEQTNVANSLQRRETDLQSREASMMTQMQEMMMTMMRNGNRNNGNNGNNDQNNNNNNYNRGGRNNQNRGRGRGRGRSNERSNTRSQPRSYCHTHGACAHSSSNCNTPAQGHQNLATFNNMLNGSHDGCYWLTPP